MNTTPQVIVPHAKIAEFCRRWDITEVALFGSVLRNDFGADSDVDILVTFAPGVRYGFKQLIAMENELEAIFGREVDLLDKQAVEQSPNYIRRRAILESSEVVYA
jgi:uncharacterized protein